MKDISIERPAPYPKNTQDMEPGDFGILMGHVFNGNLVLRAFDTFVLVENAESVWPDSFSQPVEILPPGTKITIIV